IWGPRRYRPRQWLALTDCDQDQAPSAARLQAAANAAETRADRRDPRPIALRSANAGSRDQLSDQQMFWGQRWPLRWPVSSMHPPPPQFLRSAEHEAYMLG